MPERISLLAKKILHEKGAHISLSEEEQALILRQLVTRLPSPALEEFSRNANPHSLEKCLRNRRDNLLSHRKLTPELIAHCKRYLFPIALNASGDRAEADEYVQATLARMVEKHNQYLGDSSFTTWLLHILINIMRSEWRKKPIHYVPQPECSPEFFESSFQGDTDDTEKICANREKIRKILEYASIILVEKHSYEVFQLRFIQNMSPEQVAQTLGLSSGYVYKILSLARKRLKDSPRVRAVLEDR